jgi:hypothetical protein
VSVIAYRFGLGEGYVMKYRHIGLGWAAMTFPVVGLLVAASAPSFAQAQPNTPGAQAEACR